MRKKQRKNNFFNSIFLKAFVWLAGVILEEIPVIGVTVKLAGILI